MFGWVAGPAGYGNGNACDGEQQQGRAEWEQHDARVRELGTQLRRRKKLRARDHGKLHAYWCASWALSHLALLLASDGGASVRARCERLADQRPALAHELTWSLGRLGVSPFLVRGAWLASKLPGQVLPFAKRRYLGAFEIQGLG